MMKKLLLFLLILSIVALGFTESKRIFGYFTQRQLAGAITQWYLSDSPGNSVGNSKLVVETKDSTYYRMMFEQFGLTKYGSTRNDGTPTTVLWTDADGNFLKSPMPAYVTSSALVTALVPYATTSSLTSGLSAKQNGVTLTTTGSSGASTFNPTTGSLNIPNYASSTYTAGTGIGIASNVITNSSPDQTVVLTAGSGISVTGTYPNFTITNTYKPTVNIAPARVLNTNYTPSASRPTLGIYTVTCQTTNPLLLGTSSATVFAEYSTNAGSSWSAISSNGSSNGVGVTVTVQLQVGQISTLVVPITEGWLVRLRTATSGTASVVLTEQKEFNL